MKRTILLVSASFADSLNVEDGLDKADKDRCAESFADAFEEFGEMIILSSEIAGYKYVYEEAVDDTGGFNAVIRIVLKSGVFIYSVVSASEINEIITQMEQR